jgi:hypothetical protein
MWLTAARSVPFGVLATDKSLLAGGNFYNSTVGQTAFKDFSYRIYLGNSGETLMRDSVWYMRFLQPLNPTTYGTRLFIQGAGGKLDVPRTYISGDVTAVIRYTLMSVDWDATDEDVDYDAQPAPAGDDPYIDITLTAADGYQVAKRSSVLEFSGIANKNYYGIKAEVVSLAGYTFSQICDVEIPATIAFGVDSGYVFECGSDPCESLPCEPSSGSYAYTDGGCYVQLTLAEEGDCFYGCEPVEFWPPYYWSKTCSYAVTGSTVTPMGGAYITVSGCDFCSLRIYSHQPPTEIEVVSRSLAANVATLKTATPHGLIHYGGESSTYSTSPSYIQGVDNAAALAIVSTARASNLMTITTADAHGLVVGDYVDVWSSGHSGAVLNVTAPVTANSFRVTSVGTSYTTRAEGGSVRKLVYDARSWTKVEAVDATTISYARTGPNESETPCSGKLIML